MEVAALALLVSCCWPTVDALKLGTVDETTDVERNKVTTVIITKTVKNETKAEKVVMEKAVPENQEMVKMRSYVQDLRDESEMLYNATISATKESITLFDLAADYSESTDLFTNAAYAGVVKDLFSRATGWADYMAEPYVPETTGREVRFAACGGVCPWIEYDLKSYSDTGIDVKYTSASAPHIVFVMVDDWGWNDLGSESTYLQFTTPTLDRMAASGLHLTNYFTHSSSIPSRGAFLTGRYSVRLGLSAYSDDEASELPPGETTLAQELQSAGYKTYLVGQWQLGYSTKSQLPTRRGFDYFYGTLAGVADHWAKTAKVGGKAYYDLQDGESLAASAAGTTGSDVHAAHVLQAKAEEYIAWHAKNFDTPMFLYYSMPLMGTNWKAPAEYQARCTYPAALDVTDDRDAMYNYCALNVMLDEVRPRLQPPLPCSFS